MSTTIFESGAKVPSAINVSTPSTPFEVRTASVFTRLTARCSSTRTVASPLNGVAMNRTPPGGTAGLGLGVGDCAAACDGVADGDGAASGAGPQAATSSGIKRRMRTSDKTGRTRSGYTARSSIDREGRLRDDGKGRDDRRPRRVEPPRDREPDEPTGDRDGKCRGDPRPDRQPAAHGDRHGGAAGAGPERRAEVVEDLH